MKDGSAEHSVDERYSQWKSLVPVLYDWLANHNLVWPSLSCRWGPKVEQATYKNRQRLYLSEQTDGTVPNTLVIANIEIVKTRVAAAEHIAQFNEESRSPFVKKSKTIIHPGEFSSVLTPPPSSLHASRRRNNLSTSRCRLCIQLKALAKPPLHFHSCKGNRRTRVAMTVLIWFAQCLYSRIVMKLKIWFIPEL